MGISLNYYPFHIGDFAAHTSHLSWEEDIAYRRMLDWYYLNERALPLDEARIARLIRMPKALPAIRVVLEEFFARGDDGWHNKRADQELTSMLAKQEQQATKDEHESERMRRYRERRASMFAALRVVHVVPAWDVPMKELQRLFDTHCNAPETDLQREQVISQNGPATAIPTPTPTPTPENKTPLTPGGGCARFEEFWAAWPKSERKQDKVKCAKKWKQSGLDGAAESILADIGVKMTTRKWQEGYVEAPLVYLNGRRWEDGVSADGPDNDVPAAFLGAI